MRATKSWNHYLGKVNFLPSWYSGLITLAPARRQLRVVFDYSLIEIRMQSNFPLIDQALLTNKRLLSTMLRTSSVLFFIASVVAFATTPPTITTDNLTNCGYVPNDLRRIGELEGLARIAGRTALITPSEETYLALANEFPGRTRTSKTTSAKPEASAALNACDLNQDGVVNVLDAQMAVDMYMGVLTPCTANIDGPGVCNPSVVNTVVTAVLGGACAVESYVALTWTASTSPNISGYNVYRATVSGGPYTAVNTGLVTAPSYTDSSVQTGQTYYYVVTAVNTSEVESGYSNQATAAVPSS